jgi:hypothetical protein
VNEIRVVVAWLQTVCTEVNDVVTRSREPLTKVFFQSKSAMIGGDSNTHVSPY